MSITDLSNMCLHEVHHDLLDLKVSVHEVTWQASAWAYRHACRKVCSAVTDEQLSRKDMQIAVSSSVDLKLTVLAILAKTLSWNDWRACRLASWSRPPIVIALASTPDHCAVPCVATGRSTVSATTEMASSASSGATAKHLRLGKRKGQSSLVQLEKRASVSAGLSFCCDILSEAFQLLLSNTLEQSSSSKEPIYLYTSVDTLGRTVHLGVRARTEEFNARVRCMAAKSELEAANRVTSPDAINKGLEVSSSQTRSAI